MAKRLLLSARLLLRDWKSGELRVLILALIIAVASMTSIGIFTDRIERSMTDQAGQFLGADLILRSSSKIDEQIIHQAHKLNLSTSSAITFSSVTLANDQFQLAHIKAVDRHYPLLSNIRIASTPYGEERVSTGSPQQGEAWLAPRLFSALGLQLNDLIEIGDISLKATAVLKHDPGQASSLITIAPRLIMNIHDVVSTGIIQPGSRVTYLLSLSGNPVNRKHFEEWISPKLNNTQALIGGTEGSQAISSALDKARQYLSLSSILSVLLSGIAIAMSANRYGQRHFDQAALMRSMGASQSYIIQIFSYQLIILGLISTTIGIFTGYIAQQGLVLILQDIINNELPAPYAYPVIIGFISGFITLIGFSLPALLRLKSVSPLRVLRKDITPLPISSYFVYSLAIICLATLMWIQSGHIILTFIILITLLCCAVFLTILSMLLTQLGKLLIPVLTGPWRMGLQQLIRERKDNLLQILAFGISLLILMTIFLLRTDLIDRWQAQLPEDAPNHFVINIQPYEVDTVQAFFENQNIQTEGIYPMVRGRITHINATPIEDTIKQGERLDESLKRELNLSWATNLQKNNKIIKGHWWNEEDSNQRNISIEKGLAKRLGVSLGDTLSFSISDSSITAKISSIRSVEWESFQPNFYIIFPESTIDKFPTSFISSFYINSDMKPVLNKLIKKYPTLTILEIDKIMEQVRSIMSQASLAIEYVMLFVLIAGTMVLIASMQSSMELRNHNAVIMRTLGASRNYLRINLITEFAFLGLMAGLVSVIGTEIIAALLYIYVFNLDFQFHYRLWTLGPVISILLILTISWIYMRHIPDQSPLKIMRATS